MKAEFNLQNLRFNPAELSTNHQLFTIDEEYIRQRQQAQIHAQATNPNFHMMNSNFLRDTNNQSPHAAARTLKEIYKLCKTNDEESEEEDSESLERANELFMQASDEEDQSEQEMLLEMSSFHSEYDSVDLNEKLKNDDSFKLKTHAFSQVQTMNSINDRHDDP